jgi:hypothetical protein
MTAATTHMTFFPYRYFSVELFIQSMTYHIHWKYYLTAQTDRKVTGQRCTQPGHIANSFRSGIFDANIEQTIFLVRKRTVQDRKHFLKTFSSIEIVAALLFQQCRS